MGADMIYVNSSYTKKRIERIYGHKDIQILYPPIDDQFRVCTGDLKKAQKMILEDRGIKKDFVLLHGRQIKDKHPEWAIEAFSKIKDDAYQLVISGTIEEENKLLGLISDLGIKDKVHLLGRVSEEELLALYNHAKCFIMAAPKEDFGLTTVEALACGCPAVAWNDGAGPSEVITKDNGLLAQPYDIGDLTLKIKSVLNKDYNRLTVSKSVDKFKAKAIKDEFLKAIEKAGLEYEYRYHP
jgi:glycosyltransferase involved in cell wall biosynthesis